MVATTTVAAALIAVMGACSPAADGGAAPPTVRDSLGVAIVESIGVDWPLQESPVRLGLLVHPSRSLDFVPWGIAADSDAGLVYVADQSEATVVVFDSMGTHVRDVGRRREGPGDFLQPSAVAVDDQATLNVLDSRHGFISRWSPDGT